MPENTNHQPMVEATSSTSDDGDGSDEASENPLSTNKIMGNNHEETDNGDNDEGESLTMNHPLSTRNDTKESLGDHTASTTESNQVEDRDNDDDNNNNNGNDKIKNANDKVVVMAFHHRQVSSHRMERISKIGSNDSGNDNSSNMDKVVEEEIDGSSNRNGGNHEEDSRLNETSVIKTEEEQQHQEEEKYSDNISPLLPEVPDLNDYQDQVESEEKKSQEPLSTDADASDISDMVDQQQQQPNESNNTLLQQQHQNSPIKQLAVFTYKGASPVSQEHSSASYFQQSIHSSPRMSESSSMLSMETGGGGGGTIPPIANTTQAPYQQQQQQQASPQRIMLPSSHQIPQQLQQQQQQQQYYLEQQQLLQQQQQQNQPASFVPLSRHISLLPYEYHHQQQHAGPPYPQQHLHQGLTPPAPMYTQVGGGFVPPRLSPMPPQQHQHHQGAGISGGGGGGRRKIRLRLEEDGRRKQQLLQKLQQEEQQKKKQVKRVSWFSRSPLLNKKEQLQGLLHPVHEHNNETNKTESDDKEGNGDMNKKNINNAYIDHGTITVSWFDGTTSVELQEHVKRSVIRKIEDSTSNDDTAADIELSDLRIIDESSDPPEEIVLSTYIPDGSSFLLRFSTNDTSLPLSPSINNAKAEKTTTPLSPTSSTGTDRRTLETANSISIPVSPSAAPSPHPSSSDLSGLNAEQLRIIGAKLDDHKMKSTQKNKNNRPSTDISADNGDSHRSHPESVFVDKSKKSNKKDSSNDDGVKDKSNLVDAVPTDDKNRTTASGAGGTGSSDDSTMDGKFEEIKRLILETNSQKQKKRSSSSSSDQYYKGEKRHVLMVLANYFAVFIFMVTVAAEIQDRLPGWMEWMEKQLESVRNCSEDQDTLYECVSNGDFAGLIASFLLVVTRSAVTKQIFLFGFHSPKKLWTVVYESGVTAFCWGSSYLIIRRGMNPDTRQNFIRKYWKDAVYGSLAGFNASFMKAVLKNLIPEEVFENALDNSNRLKILSWLPYFE